MSSIIAQTYLQFLQCKECTHTGLYEAAHCIKCKLFITSITGNPNAKPDTCHVIDVVGVIVIKTKAYVVVPYGYDFATAQDVNKQIIEYVNGRKDVRILEVVD